MTHAVTRAPALAPVLDHRRPAERRKLVSLLLSGASVLMLAPRRIGKTWLMNRVREDLEKQGVRAIKIEVAGLSTEQEFLTTLCTVIESAHGDWDRFKNQVFQRWRQLTGDNPTGTLTQAASRLDPRQFLETLVQGMNEGETRTVILIDEFALFVQECARRDADAARLLLYLIRKLWQDCPNVVWFLTGSVGLDEIARRYNMAGALLGIELVPLEPFSAEEARSLVDELQARQIIGAFTFAEGAFEHLATELGWLSPYYIEHVLKQVQAPDGRVDVEGVEAAFNKLLAPAYRTHFAGWDEHIDKNFLPEDAGIMLAILEIAAQHADGEIEATFLTKFGVGLSRRKLLNLLTALANDAYLVKHGERWRFRSGLLRRYWLEYVA